jgi:hypothetical protein
MQDGDKGALVFPWQKVGSGSNFCLFCFPLFFYITGFVVVVQEGLFSGRASSTGDLAALLYVIPGGASIAEPGVPCEGWAVCM